MVGSAPPQEAGNYVGRLVWLLLQNQMAPINVSCFQMGNCLSKILD